MIALSIAAVRHLGKQRRNHRPCRAGLDTRFNRGKDRGHADGSTGPGFRHEVQSSNPYAMVRYDAMCRAIQEAYEVDEVKDMRDKAMALQAYARQAQNVEMERQACEIRLRAERRVGQLLKVMDKAEGGRPTDKTCHDTGQVSTLPELGISRNQSSQWQKLADVDDELFETAVKEDRPTTGGIIAKAEPPREPKKNAVSAPALWF